MERTGLDRSGAAGRNCMAGGCAGIPASCRAPAALLLIVMLMILTACGNSSAKENTDPAADGAYSSGDAVVETERSVPAEEQAAGAESEQVAAVSGETSGQAGTGELSEAGSESAAISRTVRLSYANYTYVDSGDALIPKMIRNVERKVVLADDSQETLLCGVIEALRSLPEGTEGAETMVSDLYPVNGIAVDGGTAVVDVSGDQIANASMYDEEFFVYQVADSILHTDSSIRSVRFTIDGSQEKGFLYTDIHQEFDETACNQFSGG